MIVLGNTNQWYFTKIAAVPTLPTSIQKWVKTPKKGQMGHIRQSAACRSNNIFLPCGFTQAVQPGFNYRLPLYAGLVMMVFALGTTPGL
jgi:sulfite exporter TauE/SafE